MPGGEQRAWKAWGAGAIPTSSIKENNSVQETLTKSLQMLDWRQRVGVGGVN